MDKWIYMEITLRFFRAGHHDLEAILVNGERAEPPLGVRTRSQALEHYGKLGWILVKSYSDVYTFKRAVMK